MKVGPVRGWNPRRSDAHEDEAGYMLLAVVVLVALVLVALAVAAPVVARQLRREKEIESQHRMNEYVRAIQLYYRKNKNYPTSFKMLDGANNIRYIRQQYTDPLTGKADWQPIHMGEQQTKTKIFGKELSEIQGLGAAPAGAGTGFVSPGGVGGTGVGGTGVSGTGVGGTSVTGTNALNSGFGGAQIGGSTGTSGPVGATGSSGSLGDGSSIGPIIGLRPAKSGPSITQPRGETTFETWEFWYDPLLERLRVLSKPLGGGGLGNTSSGISSTDAGSYTGAGGASGATGTNGVNGGAGASGATGTTGNTGFGKSPF